jgi:hypothetical protein
MTITLILVTLGLLALSFVVITARSHALAKRNLEGLAGKIQPVDIEAFRNLIDPAEEDYLRRSLLAPEFRSIQRERLVTAVEYISCASQNASLLLRLAQAAAGSEDQAVSEAAQRMINGATRMRIFALQAKAKLYVGILFPGLRISAGSVAEIYEQLTRDAVTLRCLQVPNRALSRAS